MDKGFLVMNSDDDRVDDDARGAARDAAAYAVRV
jgi:hypothetical protein